MEDWIALSQTLAMMLGILHAQSPCGGSSTPEQAFFDIALANNGNSE
jgi:hypothetical protein